MGLTRRIRFQGKGAMVVPLGSATAAASALIPRNWFRRLPQAVDEPTNPDAQPSSPDRRRSLHGLHGPEPADITRRSMSVSSWTAESATGRTFIEHRKRSWSG